MNKTNPREKLEAVIFMSTIASRKSEGLTASHSRGSDEYTGDSIIGGFMTWDKDGRKTGAFILDCLRHTGQAVGDEANKPKRITLVAFLMWLGILAIVVATLISGCDIAYAEIGQASYFSNIETGGKNCADGKYHDLNTELVAASWRFDIGTLISVSTEDGRQVICRVVDRGPGRRNGTSRYYKGTRIIDLSVAAFSKLSPLSAGVIKVEVVPCQ